MVSFESVNPAADADAWCESANIHVIGGPPSRSNFSHFHALLHEILDPPLHVLPQIYVAVTDPGFLAGMEDATRVFWENFRENMESRKFLPVVDPEKHQGWEEWHTHTNHEK